MNTTSVRRLTTTTTGQSAWPSTTGPRAWPSTTGPRAWHNHLPCWIVESVAYERYRPVARHLLQEIANACDAPDQDGSLIGAFGGRALIEACGVSRSTFWSHLSRLDSDGFVVLLGRGGVVGVRAVANVYGIPGYRGALDQRRCRRERVRMVRTDDRLTRHVLQPGEQVTLWGDSPRTDAAIASPRKRAKHKGSGVPRAPTSRGSPGIGLGVVRESDGGSPGIGHYHPPIPSPLYQRHGHGAQRAVKSGADAPSNTGGGKQVPHLAREDLRDTELLMVLHGDLVRRGLAQAGEYGELRFVTAAEAALRDGRNPPALFVRNIMSGRLRDPQMVLFCNQGDEEAARRRLKEYKFGVTRLEK